MLSMLNVHIDMTFKYFFQVRVKPMTRNAVVIYLKINSLETHIHR